MNKLIPKGKYYTAQEMLKQFEKTRLDGEKNDMNPHPCIDLDCYSCKHRNIHEMPACYVDPTPGHTDAWTENIMKLVMRDLTSSNLELI